MIGRAIGKQLVADGHELIVVSRNQTQAKLNCPFPCTVIEANLQHEPIVSPLLQHVQAVIHLAGESVAESRWSEKKKRAIYDSRVRGTQNLLKSFAEIRNQVRVFISNSASGYYGDRGEEILLEDSSARGEGFLADVCVDWERPIELAQKQDQFRHCRFLILRVPMVLAPSGGVLQRMRALYRNGLGGVIGRGSQWMSWIHLADLVRLYSQGLMDSRYFGVINAVAPEPVTNLDFTQGMVKSLNSSIGPRVPKLALQVAFGEMAQVVLSSQRIEPQRLYRLQFEYQFPSLEQALADCNEPYSTGDQLLVTEQYLPAQLEQVFSFFSEAKNLERLTPAILKFQVLKMSTEEIESGSLIDYRLKIRGVPVNWQTKIIDWRPPHAFVDSQVKGPYAKWHHSHEFSTLGPGTLMRDIVRYKLPAGWMGELMAGKFIRRDINEIFAYRRKVCAALSFKKF